LCDTVIEVFKLEMFISYHHEFIANFMIYLTSFTKKTNILTSVGIINSLKKFYLSFIFVAYLYFMYFKCLFQDLLDVLCSIFINLIVTLSGYDSVSFTNNSKLNCSVFPVALATYSKNTSQVRMMYLICFSLLKLLFCSLLG